MSEVSKLETVSWQQRFLTFQLETNSELPDQTQLGQELNLNLANRTYLISELLNVASPVIPSVLSK